jgi:hypothetical protein
MGQALVCCCHPPLPPPHSPPAPFTCPPPLPGASGSHDDCRLHSHTCAGASHDDASCEGGRQSPGSGGPPGGVYGRRYGGRDGRHGGAGGGAGGYESDEELKEAMMNSKLDAITNGGLRLRVLVVDNFAG